MADAPGPNQTKGYVTNPVPASTTRTKATEGSGTVVALMGFTMLFALIGNEIEHLDKNADVPANQAGALGPAVKIMVGGTVATSILVLATHAGDAGRELALGLALVTMVTATLVYGAPVWEALNGAFGSTPTGGTGATTPTTPGSGTIASTATIATNLAGG